MNFKFDFKLDWEETEMDVFGMKNDQEREIRAIQPSMVK